LKAPFTANQEVAPVTDWERIVREHGPRVFGTAWRILGHAADAEDVVQEVFLQAHQLHTIRSVRCWPAFLHRLAACRALDRLRRRRATVPLDGHDPACAEDGPEEAAIGNELAGRLRDAVAALPGREAEVFCLRYYEDLSYEEIAESLGMRVGAVGVALHKARAKLESQFSPAVRGE
jgi:RNA polymerase sigma-70 factor, ECF subfamily